MISIATIFQSKLSTEQKILLWGFLLIILFHLPFIILGEESFVIIHDNLDSEFIYLHILKISGNLFGFDSSVMVPNILNGLPRRYFHSEFSFVRVLFYFFPSFWAYVINSFIVRMIGFLGIYYLAKDYFQGQDRPVSTLLIAFAFSALPIYPLFGVSVLGQPLLLWAFFNLLGRKKLAISFSIIFLFPAYAHFAMTAPFFLICLTLFGIYQCIWVKKKFTLFYWTGIGIIFISFICFNILTIESFLFGSELSHRTGMIKNEPNLFFIGRSIVKTILFGQYHSAEFNSFPIIALLVYAVLTNKGKVVNALKLIVLIIGIAFFSGLNEFIEYYFGDDIVLVGSFNFGRFTFLIPFTFFLIFLILNRTRKIKNTILYFGIGAQLIFILYGNLEFKKNIINLLPGENRDITTFRSFYSEKLFDEIENYIQLPKEDFRTVSIGIHPSIAQYNGFYTLDSYQNNYPMVYKKEFREIISKELDKSKWLREYYDNWGSRAYIFSAELRKSCYLDCQKGSEAKIQDISLNTDKLKEMGGLYIFSAVPILNAKELDLQKEKVFENNTSRWKIHLYKVQ